MSTIVISRPARTALALALGVAVVCAGMVATPAHSAQNEPTPSAGDLGTSRIALDHGVSLADAQVAGGRSGRDVVGYRYSDLNVVGEYYPIESVTPDDFTDSYREQFGTEPRITELVVLREDPRASARGVVGITAQEPNLLDGAGDLTAGLDAVPESFSTEGTVWDSAREDVDDAQARSKTGTVDAASPDVTTMAVPAPIAQDWKPSTVQVSGSGWRSSSVTAGVNMHNYWITSPGAGLQGENFNNVPAKWGVEFKVTLINTAIESSHPSLRRTPTAQGECPGITDVRNQFWARNDTFSGWSIYNFGPAANLTQIGAYLDWNDEASLCSAQTFSLGIGYPRKMPKTYNNNFEFITNVYSTFGSATSSSLVTSEIRAVEGYSCEVFPYVAPDSSCMGTDTSRTWPVTNYTSFVSLFTRTGAALTTSPSVRQPVYSGDTLIPQNCVTFNRGRVPIRQCWAS
ncbi:hypothetical protein ACFXQA_01735 [Microbacterium sp. P07]|uniref:hypothetical protein n=1 Tax=Microbacterium sp. P07 TaxID=3366952 RepID=UPI003744C37A